MKSNIGASIDKELKKKIYEYCEKNSINLSRLIERLLKEFLESPNVQ